MWRGSTICQSASRSLQTSVRLLHGFSFHIYSIELSSSSDRIIIFNNVSQIIHCSYLNQTMVQNIIAVRNMDQVQQLKYFPSDVQPQGMWS